MKRGSPPTCGWSGWRSRRCSATPGTSTGCPRTIPRRTYVEFTLEPSGAGTRLTVVESGFAQLSEDGYRKAFDGNTEGWAKELGELADYLDAA